MLTAAAAMEEKITPVIIDNTNTQAWEMKPYLKLVCIFCPVLNF